ncbi:uncharacterized protein F4817DRAFT_368170 [Daldinia loculata]|uniref:uncharacterized protein n=1 Tax=Daldinia loculata TaxID=103429 RepID=UPI0020C30AAF|nr:uncharacterized protein F4817DRAFT_368170 [Daldinia loculata]KAI1643716.1 hypothetical protein F4817DRAFT_368170 [Daldinia loculata]
MTTPAMPPRPAATADPPSVEETNGPTGAEGARYSRKRKRDEPESPKLRGHFLEVDENDIVRSVLVDPDHVSGEIEIPIDEAVKVSPRKTSHNPIQWRSHSEVAIEVREFKQALALHDLVDEDNVHLMVVTRDHVIIQGQVDQVIEMYHTVGQSLGFSKEPICCCLQQVSGQRNLLRRQEHRKGGLVNIHYEYIPMDWKKANQLMSKEFPLIDYYESLVVLEVRLADESPQGKLKPGRRLVPVPTTLTPAFMREA